MTNKPPLYLPSGSVRAVLALIICGGFVVGCFVQWMPKENLVALSGLAGVISTYYFRAREDGSASPAREATPVNPVDIVQ